ncbi:MAG TPA: hypothetical protein VK171_15670 [Fimbriimonas sp.]|nr:hypothetical protein [Fimbriimonas sp.]
MTIWLTVHALLSEPKPQIKREKPAVSVRLKSSYKANASLPSSKIQLKPSLPRPEATGLLNSILEPSEPTKIFTSAQPFASPLAPLAEKRVNLNLVTTPLETVVSVLSKQAGVNIVLLTKSDQKVTISVKNMVLGEALKHLATLAGIRVLKVNNTVVMADEATLKASYPDEYAAETVKPEVPPVVEPAPTVDRVITMKHQSAGKMEKALVEYLKTRGVSIVALPETLIPFLPNTGFGSPAVDSQAGLIATGRSKRLLLSGPADQVMATMKIIEQMDMPRAQVEITVTVHDISNEALEEKGISWAFGQTNVTEVPNGGVNVGTFSRSGLNFTGTIKALEQANKAKLLASPNVSVMDGELGSILIGEKRRFPVVAGTNSNGQFIYSTEEQNVGISLLVAADITADGTITMAVNAQVSSILGFLQLNGGSYPQVSTRESKSTLTLKDGESMVMGGLLRDEEIVNFEKVPFLSQIPFFGELFKNRKKQKQSGHLMISITPRVIKQ